MKRRRRRSNSLQRLKPRQASLKRQSLKVIRQTWKMLKRRSLTRQRKRKMMKPEKAS